MAESSEAGCLWAGIFLIAASIWAGSKVYGWYEVAHHTPSQSTPLTPSNDELRSTKDYGYHMEQYLPNDLNFYQTSLVTSWANSSTGGVLRYQVKITPPTNTADDQSLSAKLTRLSSCAIDLKLEDQAGFLIATLPIRFTRELDLQQHVDALSTNDMVPMTREDYVNLYKQGSWEVVYSCL